METSEVLIMPVTVTCLHCDQGLTAPDELAGTLALCAYCQLPVKVEGTPLPPSAPSAGQASAAKATVRGASKPAPAAKGTGAAATERRGLPWTAVMVTAFLAVVALGGAAYYFDWNPSFPTETRST